MALAPITRVSAARPQNVRYLPRTTPPVHPYQFTWTTNKDDEMIALDILGLPTESIAHKFVYGLTITQAQRWVCTRLRLLISSTDIPRDWQRAYYKSPETTTTEGYTLEEDIELLQWRANGRLVINAQIFVVGNRSAAGMCRRADWLCGLPGLFDKVVRIEEEIEEKQNAAEKHAARERLCGHCDRRVLVSDWLTDRMDGKNQ